MSRVYNFSAGPSALPERVLSEVQRELLEYGDTGMSILEMSHRTPAFSQESSFSRRPFSMESTALGS